MKKYLITCLLALSSFSVQASDGSLTGKKMDFFKEKHVKIIKNKCLQGNNAKDCIIKEITHFYKGLNLLKEPHGVKYYKKCYERNKDDNYFDYEGINHCATNYYNILSHNFLNKKYNHIFLEEGSIISNIAHNCNNTKGDVIDLDYINKCIAEQNQSYKFFKLNFFNSQNQKVEKVFEYCMEKHKDSDYAFDFSRVNLCIKKNTYNF